MWLDERRQEKGFMWLDRMREKLEVLGRYGRKSLKCLDKTGEKLQVAGQDGRKGSSA